MALPWMVVLLTHGVPQSISITFYDQRAVAVFMAILGATGFLLIAYKGYERIDDILNTVAGIMALGVCVFSCYCSRFDRVGTFQLKPEVSDIIHCACAITFFGILAFNSLVLFTKTSGEMTRNKRIRNIIFRVCGVGMLAAFLLMLLPSSVLPNKTWVTEMIALTFFAVSWLTKANCYRWLFCDKK